ncbi:GNAT family N-acetyltransferase [Zooshikella ganghwensis]|nr:GNAT family N-acetyltransferase [Zooshikella ganghwensis]
MEIESKRLKMRPIREADWALFLQLHTDPNVISLCFDEPEIEVIRDKFEARLVTWSPTSNAWLCLVIIDKITDNVMGITGFIVEDNTAHVGYLLLPEFHGKQYGTESLLALLDWAESIDTITHYKAVVTEGNVSSERVLVKCGFQLQSVIPEAYEIGGKLYADHIYTRDAKVT